MTTRKFQYDFIPFRPGEIESLGDEQIENQIAFFRRARKEAERLDYDTLVYEEEICYLYHEMQLREQYARGDYASFSLGV